MPPRLKVKLLGRFEVRRDGQPITAAEWRGHKTRDLLKILLLAKGSYVAREQLIEWLWPAERRHAHRNTAALNLRSAISDLRKTLEPQLSRGRDSAFIQTQRQGYAFDFGAPFTLDTLEFERTASLRQASRAELESALGLYAGDLLEEDPYAEWAMRERDRLRELRLGLLQRLSDSWFDESAYAQCIQACQHALALDPSRESLWRLLMRACWHSGDRTAALAAFDRCRAALARDLGVDPLPETTALHAQILRDETAPVQAVAAPPPEQAPGARSGRWLYRLGAASLALWATLTGASLWLSLAGIVRGTFVSSGDPGRDALPYLLDHPDALAEISRSLYFYFPLGILLLPGYAAWFAVLHAGGRTGALGWLGLSLGGVDAVSQALSRAIGLAQIIVLPPAYLQAPADQRLSLVALWDVLRQLASISGTLSLVAHPAAILLLSSASLLHPQTPIRRPFVWAGLGLAVLAGTYYALPAGPLSLPLGVLLATAVRLWFLGLALVLWRA